MNRFFPQALVVVVCFALFLSTHAHGSTTKPAYLQGRQQTVVVRLSDLRSAYLIRAGVVRYEASDRSPEGIRRQLQDHFHVVLALLHTSTSLSIEMALRRLEDSQHVAWSSSDRANWHRYLLAARSIQLQRLRDYRDRGRFPINDRYSDEPIPIFVDRDDTACAVGQLMRLSDNESTVASIEAGDNYVYVPDVERGPIADWILTSGLTLEEAALIQPAYNWRYEPAPLPDDAIQLTHDWSGEFGDLRFSNFQVFSEVDGADMPLVNIPVSHRFCEPQFLGCVDVVPLRPVDVATNGSEDVTIVRVSESQFASNSTLPADAPYGAEYRRVLIQFDVDVLSPMQRIVGRPQASTLSARQIRPYSRNDISLFVGRNLSQAYIDQPTTRPDVTFITIPLPDGPLVDHNGTRELELTQHLTVVTELLLRHGQSHQAQLMEFEVVTIPEPATWLLLMISAVTMTAVCRNRNSPRS